jgi:hypothetical protein
MTNTSKITALFAASTIAAASLLSGTAFAQVTGAIPNSPSAVEADTGMGTRAQGSPVTVKRVDALENDEMRRYENISADEIAAAQQEIASNPALAAELQAQGVQLNNVVDIQTFSNGGALVYVR